MGRARRWLWAIAGALAWGVPLHAADERSQRELDHRIGERVAQELAARKAATSADLVPGAPRRALGATRAGTLEHTEGRVLMALVALAPGPPGRLRVPTQLDLRIMVERAADGSIVKVGVPPREMLATAVALALKGEQRAFDEARVALNKHGAKKPPGVRTWAEALHLIRLDPRLPREQYAGSPTWSLLFEPYDEAKGGWNSVLIDAEGFWVKSVSGRDP
jgi:hypothetical protein